MKINKFFSMTTSEFARVLIFAVILVLCIYAWPAEAAGWNILLGSYHVADGEYCEFNPGIGYTFENRQSVMVYKNSQCNIGLTWSQSSLISKNWSYSWGTAFGYRDKPVIPFLTVQYTAGPVYIGILPGELVKSDNIFFMGVRLD